jgi:hypothetical protein
MDRGCFLSERGPCRGNLNIIAFQGATRFLCDGHKNFWTIWLEEDNPNGLGTWIDMMSDRHQRAIMEMSRNG